MATQNGSAELRSRPPEAGVAGEAETHEGRPMRADARRNRELLVAAAHDVFASQGAGAPMEAIAKEAGVGVGTLYRHFPNRLDLVEAVYQTDVEELWETAQRVVAELEPWPAVEAFFVAFRRYARRSRPSWWSSARPSRRTRTCGHAPVGASSPRSTSSSNGPRRQVPCGGMSPARTSCSWWVPFAPIRASSRTRPPASWNMVLDGLRADAAVERSRLTGTTLPGSIAIAAASLSPDGLNVADMDGARER